MKPSKKDEKGSSSIESVEGLAVSYIYMFEMNIVKNEINLEWNRWSINFTI